jgi:hypothetical protein
MQIVSRVRQDVFGFSSIGFPAISVSNKISLTLTLLDKKWQKTFNDAPLKN